MNFPIADIAPTNLRSKFQRRSSIYWHDKHLEQYRTDYSN